MPEPLLRVENLKKYFPIVKGRVFDRVTGYLKAVDGIDFVIHQGETLGLAGESGCGKTTTAMMVLRVYTPTAGTIRFRNKDIFLLRGKDNRDYHRSVQAMFQDPYASLSPRQRVRSIITEPLIVNGITDKHDVEERLKNALQQVGLDYGAGELYPHEFSGGQRQRIALARAIVLKPDLVILDEPVSALDVSIRAQVMNLLKDIQQRLGLTYLLIAHNLGTMRYMCHWIGVMYLGKIMEMATAEELFTHPLHPYTNALFSAALPSTPDNKKERIILQGEVPSPVNIPPGCRFHPRCFNNSRGCNDPDGEPPLKQVNPNHFVACRRYS